MRCNMTNTEYSAYLASVLTENGLQPFATEEIYLRAQSKAKNKNKSKKANKKPDLVDKRQTRSKESKC